MFMANNMIRMAWLARHLFFIALLLLTGKINGQSIEKYYTSSLQEKGTLYFIFPQSGFENNKTKSKLIYDITYFETTDTVTLNFSYFDKLERTIDSVIFVNTNQRFSGSIKKLFIETNKSKWHYRYTSKILFTDINSFFNQTNNPTIILYTQQGIIELNIKTKNWKKQSSVTKKILTLIKYNQ